MNNDIDLKRLGEIADPFAEAVHPPLRPMGVQEMPWSPNRSRVRALRIVAVVAALLYDLAWLAFVETRPDIHSIPPEQLASGLTIPLVSAAMAIGAGTRSGARGLGDPKWRVAAFAMAAPVWFALATLLVAPHEPHVELFWRRAAGCFFTTGLLALGPLALGVVTFRRAFVSAAVWRTAAIGVACGALASATMSLACPIGNVWHVLVGHGVILVAAGLCGAALGRCVCRT
jgi:hypothetical protein